MRQINQKAELVDIRAKSGGCGCKISPADLFPLLGAIGQQRDERVMVDGSTSDDAAVIWLTEDLAIVQTIDFFPSPVADPYEFGRIAAANALSDIYAMGAVPLSALNVVTFPIDELGGDTLAEILRGGAEICERDNVSVVGGHSIVDAEPKFGLAVTGLVDPASIVSNAGGRDGDVLVLTKPLGPSVILRAAEQNATDREMHELAIETMTETNREASKAAVEAGAHAMTDVTGFGLAGHLHHIARESNLAASIDFDAVPLLPKTIDLAAKIGTSGGTRRNMNWSSEFTSVGESVTDVAMQIVNEANTSGGLLVAVEPKFARAIPGVVIGELHSGVAGRIEIR